MLLEPKEVLFVEGTTKMGGVQFSTLYLAQHLNPERWNPTVLCPGEGELSRACERAGVDVAHMRFPTLKPTSFRIGRRRVPNLIGWVENPVAIQSSSHKLQTYLRRRQPALVVTKGLLIHLCGGLAARRESIPCIWHVQDFISERFGGLYRWGFGLAARRLPDYIVTDGTPIARQMPVDIQSRVRVVLNGVDVREFNPNVDGRSVRRELDIPTDAIVVGHVARLTPWKGQHHLIEAFDQIAAQHPSAYLVLVGSAVFDQSHYERQLHRRVRELGLEKRVVFAGYRNDLPQVLAAMDVFAYPSVEKDTSPLSLLSALAMGLPVVAFDIPGVREVVEGSASALLIPRGNELDRVSDTAIGAFSKALDRTLTQTALRDRMGGGARQLAEERLSLEVYVKEMERVFERASSGKAGD